MRFILFFSFLIGHFAILQNLWAKEKIVFNCKLELEGFWKKKTKNIEFDSRSRYDLERPVHGEWDRDDYRDARNLAESIQKQTDYLHPNALRVLLEYAFENAAGHGAAKSNSTVWSKSEVSDIGIRIFIMNDSHRVLPKKIKNKTFTNHQRLQEVPNSQRDYERGGWGMGVKAMHNALKNIYDPDLKSKAVAEMRWNQAIAKSEAHPNKVLLEVFIPKPSKKEYSQRALSVAERAKAEALKKAQDKIFEDDVKLLKEYGEGKYIGPKDPINKSKERIHKTLKEQIKKESKEPSFFSAIYALGNTKEFDPDIAETLWNLHKSQKIPDFGHSIEALSKMNAFNEKFKARYLNELSEGIQNKNYNTVSQMINLFKKMGPDAAFAKPKIIEAMGKSEIQKFNIAFTAFEALEKIGLNENDLAQLENAYKSLIVSKNFDQLYYVEKSFNLINPSDTSIRNDLLYNLTNENAAYYSHQIYKSLKFQESDLQILKKQLEIINQDEGFSDARSYYLFETMATLGPKAKSLKSVIIPFLARKEFRYRAANALEKMGLEQEDRKIIESFLAQIGEDNYLLKELLKKIPKP